MMPNAAIRSGLFLIWAFIACTFSWGQVANPAVLGETAFIRLVMESHPGSIRAELQPKIGESMVKAARGAFDPSLMGTYQQKEWAGKEYYQTLEATMQVPTWWGIKALAGYVQADGVYLDPSSSTPAEGLAAMGLEWTPLRGLMIDKRRAGLMKAKVYAGATMAERRAQLNDLVLQASEAYWEWVRSWHAKQVYDSALVLAQTRYEAVLAGWRGGARAAIDTTEAAIQVQSRQADLTFADFKLLKAKVLLETFLWTPDQQPLELKSQTVPPQLDELGMTPVRFPSATQLDSLLETHPDLLLAAYKMDLLEIERRAFAEQLKPDLSIKYQWLSSPQSMDPGSVYGPNWENYKVSAGLNFPIFFREARGQLAQTKLNLQAASLSLEEKKRQVTAKVTAFQAGYVATSDRLRITTQLQDNMLLLARAENSRFQLGESSLFLVNAREQNLIKTQLECIELATSLPLERAKYRWSLGLGSTDY